MSDTTNKPAPQRMERTPQLIGDLRNGGSTQQRIVGKLWPNWLQMCGRIARDEALNVAETSALQGLYRQLRDNGVRFDRPTVAYLRELSYLPSVPAIAKGDSRVPLEVFFETPLANVEAHG